jgi:glucuronate isomerase
MAFIDERFLLESDAAVSLYETYAASQPIFDYHCHLSPAADRREPAIQQPL